MDSSKVCVAVQGAGGAEDAGRIVLIGQTMGSRLDMR